MQNYHGITIKYLGATNTRGSRVKLTSTRFNDSITLPTNYAHNTTVGQAIEWLQQHGQRVAGTAELSPNSDIILLEAINGLFTPIREMKEGVHRPHRSYPVVANALRTNATKARAIVYGTESAAVTNEAVAMAHFVDTRMHGTDIESELAAL